jgi:hypothetical protein
MSQSNNQVLIKFDAGDINKTSAYLTHVVSSCVTPSRSFPLSERITGETHLPGPLEISGKISAEI